MKLSDDQVEILKHILNDVCCQERTIPRSEIFELFESKAKSGMEKYRFERELSRLIREDRLSGYEIRVGRNGGIAKSEPIERVTVTCSSGKYMGCMSTSKLDKFLGGLRRM